VPVIDHWWQTETGSPISNNPVGLGMLPVKHGSPACRCPATTWRSWTMPATRWPPGTLGNVVIRLPLPPGCLPTLWNADERFRSAYLSEFPGCYKTADAGYIDADGYLFIMARTDDIINVAGHRLSTGAMEEVIAEHPDVAECAVIGMADDLKGQVPCGFVVLNAGVTRDIAEIEKEVVALVREKIGPVAAFKLAVAVKRLPKTRSGKILRATMQKIADGTEWAMPATIDDPGHPRRDRHGPEGQGHRRIGCGGTQPSAFPSPRRCARRATLSDPFARGCASRPGEALRAARHDFPSLWCRFRHHQFHHRAVRARWQPPTDRGRG
jgi:propionyl-CoA synthetase